MTSAHRHDHRHRLGPAPHHRGGGRIMTTAQSVGDAGTSREGLCVDPVSQLRKVPQALSLDIRNNFVLVQSAFSSLLLFIFNF